MQAETGPSPLTPRTIRAGRCFLSVSNCDGAWRFSVRRVPANDHHRATIFVKWQDADNKWHYVGILDENHPRLIMTDASRHCDPNVLAIFKMALASIVGGPPLPTGWAVRHVGRCCKCGRRVKPYLAREGFCSICFMKER